MAAAALNKIRLIIGLPLCCCPAFTFAALWRTPAELKALIKGCSSVSPGRLKCSLNSQFDAQTVRPARSTTPLFGPIAYRIIPIIKNDQYLKPYIEQGPDLKNRLTIVLEFMNNPEVTLDPLKVPIQLDCWP